MEIFNIWNDIPDKHYGIFKNYKKLKMTAFRDKLILLLCLNKLKIPYDLT